MTHLQIAVNLSTNGDITNHLAHSEEDISTLSIEETQKAEVRVFLNVIDQRAVGARHDFLIGLENGIRRMRENAEQEALKAPSTPAPSGSQ